MKLSEQLKKKADYLASMTPAITALGMLKQAGMDEATARMHIAQEEMEKTASSRLVDSGIDYDTALQLVKSAGIKVMELPGFKAEPSEAEKLVNLLTKAASTVEKLEAQVEALSQEKGGLIEKVASLEEILDEVPEAVPAMPDSLTKLAEMGSFTSNDIEALGRVPADTLKKLASLNDQPWSMGKGAGIDPSGTDPLTAFLLG